MWIGAFIDKSVKVKPFRAEIDSIVYHFSFRDQEWPLGDARTEVCY